MAEDDRKTELIAELEGARSRVTVNFRALRRDLDIPTRAKQAFAHQPLAWIGGASFLGLIVSRFSFRKKKVVVVHKNLPRGKEGAVEKVEKAGLLIGILKMVFDLARPALTKWATKYVTDYATRRMGTRRV